MTEKEKARAYDKAIEKIKYVMEHGVQPVLTKEDLQSIFPELQESEDEKVKRIIHSISNKISFHLHDIFTEEEFQCFDAWSNAWLEKQGEPKLASSAKISKNDTLYDLLRKMPSCITVDGIDYHFVLKKAVFYRAYYEGEGEDGSGKVIFGVTAYSPIDLLTEMLEELKEEGLLE